MSKIKNISVVLVGLFIIVLLVHFYHSFKHQPINNAVVMIDSTQHAPVAPINHLPKIMQHHQKKDSISVYQGKTEVEIYTFHKNRVHIKKREFPYESNPVLSYNSTGIRVDFKRFGMCFAPYFTIELPQKTFGIHIRFLYYKRFGIFTGVTFKKSALIGLDYRTHFLSNRLMFSIGFGYQYNGFKIISFSIGF